MTHDERQKMYFPMYAIAAVLAVLNISWYSYDVLTALHWDNWVLEYFMFDVAQPMNAYKSQFTLKALILLCLTLTQILKVGKAVDMTWKRLLTYLAVALAVFLFPIIDMHSFAAQVRYMLTSLTGFLATGHAIALVGRKISGLNADLLNDLNETFDQCNALVETEDSFNLPTIYQYKHRRHHGWINIVNPFRAMMVTGTPGSGKSYSFFNPIIEQAIRKGYTMFCYDYKFPTLSKIVYNTYLENAQVYRDRYGRDVKFCVINFNDPLRSMRCNPIHPRYIAEAADTTEIARLIMNNITPESIERPDFFTRSGSSYVDLLILFLRIYKKGRYCTIPHLIELMAQDYRTLFEILIDYPETRVKLVPFKNALKDKAMEQLQGQLASAMIPLITFASPALYWVLSGDDFPLDLNSPDHPEIICMGNDPDRQSIYGLTLSLFTSRLFKQINHEGRLKSLVLFDELPTVFVKDLDNVIATARSNKVVVMLGAQDKSQLIRDYSEKIAEVIFNTVGNRISGQVNGKTAHDFAEQFGREFRQQQSETTGGETDTINTSYQQQEILTRTRIETLPQGTFFGVVADDFDVRKDLSPSDQKEFQKKLFCGNIVIDNEAFKERKKKWVPIPEQNAKLISVTKNVKETVTSNAEAECLRYMEEDTAEKEEHAQMKDENYTPLGPEAIREQTRRDYDRMSEKKRTKLLETVVRKRQDEAVNRIIQDNYERIHEDVQNILQSELDRIHLKNAEKADNNAGNTDNGQADDSAIDQDDIPDGMDTTNIS